LRLDDQLFLTIFLPVVLGAFFVIRGLAALLRAPAQATLRASLIVLLAASVVFVGLAPRGWILLATVAVAFVAAPAIESWRAAGRRRAAAALLMTTVAAAAAAFVAMRWQLGPRTFVFVGATVITCHVIAYVIDVFRGDATAARPLESALYLTQFPAVNGGPIVRSRDFSGYHLRLTHGVGLGDFTYGVRRVVIGLVKIRLIADVLGRPADLIFGLPAARVSMDAAWLAAACVSLQIYFEFSGFADLAIGLGRIVGLRYPENFRRPYVADSMREFWRRWNITAIMWLRDYLSLPIAGRDAPTPRLLLNTFLGFILIGLWHGGHVNVVMWAVFSSAWLALEAVGMGARVERLPRLLRHAYVLLVTGLGWMILRAETHAHTWVLLKAMAGAGELSAWTAARYMSAGAWGALVVAVIGAGPLVPWISRWRVTLDASTAAIVMMTTAFWLFIYRPVAQLGSLLTFPKRRRS
jgi:D-alanyl-lipoteichoic acid acyltransferase DltB (MBOAT superfamily)